MRTSIPFLQVFAGILAFASTAVELAYGAEPARTLSPTALTQSCANAALASRNVKGVAENLKDFTQDPESLTINDGYVVKIFSLKPGVHSSLKIVGIIEKGPESDAEIPRFTAICRNGVSHPSTSGKPGEIEFQSAPGDKINIRFHLNKIPNDPGNLKHTSWKATGENSIWMVGPFDEGDDTHGPPGPDDWPDCLKPKTVTLNGPDISFNFDRCANTGGTTDEYEYAVHMDQTSSGVTVDIGIDPMIINHP